MLLLQAPDRSRYISYKKQKEINLDTHYSVPVPNEITKEQEMALANALLKQHFLFIDKQIRRFWDDINGLGGLV